MKALIISILVSIISFTSCEENKPTKVVEIEEKEEYKTQTDINIGSYESYLRSEKKMYNGFLSQTPSQ